MVATVTVVLKLDSADNAFEVLAALVALLASDGNAADPILFETRLEVANV